MKVNKFCHLMFSVTHKSHELTQNVYRDAILLNSQYYERQLQSYSLDQEQSVSFDQIPLNFQDNLRFLTQGETLIKG